MFNRRKKKVLEKAQQAPQPASKLKNSLLSLEQRLMFDAAAAATASEVASEQVAQEQAEAAVSSGATDGGQTTDQRESQALLQAIATYAPGESTTEIAFVDPTVPDYQTMIAGMGPNVEVVVLDGTRDGMEQIAESLAGRSGVDAIHLISHGSAGELQLGTGTLTAESMSSEYADEFATIRGTLSDQADILVYGCNFGEGAEGGDAVNLLAELTGADVAASSDQTGHIDLGGDWEFEVQAGSIETDLALTDTAQMNWAGILGTETVQDTFSSTSYSNNNGTQSWSTSWTETDASGGGASGGDVRINSSQLRIDTDTVGNAISRGVNLSNATSATLTFNYTNSLTGADRIEMRVSTDGGTNYQTLSNGIFSNAANTGSGTASFDLSGHMSANTRIQFVVTGTGGGERLYVDNVQVSYNTGAVNSAPTIGSNGGGATANVTVAENSTVVTTVAATDADAGQTLSYSIAGGADAAKFTINSSTGQLSFASAPNYEAATDSGGNNVYDVNVQVSDGNGGTDTQAIAVTVTNVNETPTDLSLSASTVAENAANGTVIGTVSASDPDSSDTKTYSLTDAAGGRFAINSSTGQITVANGSLLNYENATSHSVTVRITDSGGLTHDETFTINLTSVNEAPTGADATVTVNEDTAHTLTMSNFGFSDVDAGDTMSVVRIDSLPSAGTLTLSGVAVTAGQVVSVANITAGNLVFTPAANATSSGYANLTFSVRDSNNAYDTTPNTLTINVTAVNDAPILSTNEGATVDEGASIILSAKNLDVVDVDNDPSQVLYTITSLPINGTILLKGTPLSVKDTFTQDDIDSGIIEYQHDGSETDSDSFAFVVDDGAGGSLEESTFKIAVTPVNDAPTDLSLSANTVGENAANGTVVGTASTTDPDEGDTHTYSLIDSAGGRFAIDTNTGEITVADGTLLNYESAMSHVITVRTTDAGGLTYDQTFTINLTNVNETPTNLSLSSNTVAENAANGTVVGTVSGTDPDSGDTKMYSLTNSAGGRFAINSSTGAITVANSSLLDYEATTSHSVTVRVTDSGGLTYDETVTINLTNVNETPTDLSLSSNTVAENSSNGTVIGTVSGTDPDASDTKTYSFTDSAGGRFAINSTTGQITVADGNLLNYENATSHSVTVRVTDSVGLTYDETFTINLTNVNEAPSGADATVTINEDTAHTLTATDLGFSDVDAGDSLSAVRINTVPSVGTLTLSGVNVTAGQVIAVADITAGNLVFAPVADANGTGYTSFTFSVRDGGSLYDSASNTITFDVTPVNDAPIAGDDSYTVQEDGTLTVNVAAGLLATDMEIDGDVSSVVLVTGSSNGTLNLNADGSFVYTPNANFSGTDTFTYKVNDGTTESNVATVTLTVSPVNDSPTAISLSGNTVPENAANGTVVGTASTTDPDTGDTHTYQLTDSAGGRFAINSATGVITVADGTLLDYEAATSHTITVRTTDAGGLTQDQTFTINLMNVNEAPTLSTNTGSTVAEEGTDTITASELAVTDVDNSAAQLTYSVGTGPAYGRLELTTAPGVSTTTFTQADIAANRLVYVHNGSETTSDSFTFTVSDGAGGSLAATTVALTITPVNDAPTITSNGGGSAASINVAENVSAVTIVTGADPDLPSQILTYSLSGGSDQALFTINASTGALNFAAPPDFEVATDANGDHTYIVQVRVTDSQGATATQTIQVTVTDLAEALASQSKALTLPPALLQTAPLESEKRGLSVVTERGNPQPSPTAPSSIEQRTRPPEMVERSGSGMMPPTPSVERPIFVKLEDIRRQDTSLNEPVMPRWDDSSAASPFTIMPVEPEQPIDSKLPEDQPSISDVLLAKLDAMAKSLEEEVGVEQEHEMMVARVAALSGTTLSVGFVAWAVRSSAVLASCLTTLPVWKSFDPLAVTKLSRQERDRRRQATDAAQRQEQDEFGGLEKFF